VSIGAKLSQETTRRQNDSQPPGGRRLRAALCRSDKDPGSLQIHPGAESVLPGRIAPKQCPRAGCGRARGCTRATSQCAGNAIAHEVPRAVSVRRGRGPENPLEKLPARREAYRRARVPAPA
jgi:hypothetical protein